jgi:S-adenosylmethionine:tRNA ribosyltransferase-isomerase
MSDQPVPFRAATHPRTASAQRLLRVDRERGTFRDHLFADLPALLEPGDVLVLNDAATVPASLRMRTDDGEPVEVRLLAHLGGTRWRAVLFGAGDWRTPTERRPAPPDGLARVITIDVGREPAAMWRSIYARGRSVQYTYRTYDVPIAEMQSPWADRPWAVEMPSAGRPITRASLFALRARGVEVASLTHAAGLSSIGDAELDAILPLPERYEIPRDTVDAIGRARERGSRVIAVGTTVVRALEGAAKNGGGRLEPGTGVTDLRIDAATEPRVVDGLLSGIHAPGESHFALLEAFADAGLLRRAAGHAALTGYLAHELGDSMLVL